MAEHQNHMDAEWSDGARHTRLKWARIQQALDGGSPAVGAGSSRATQACMRNSRRASVWRCRRVLSVLVCILAVLSPCAGAAVQHHHRPRHAGRFMQGKASGARSSETPLSLSSLPRPKHRQLTTVFYMHIYKTGGTSVKAMLGQCRASICDGVSSSPSSSRQSAGSRRALSKPNWFEQPGCLAVSSRLQAQRRTSVAVPTGHKSHRRGGKHRKGKAHKRKRNFSKRGFLDFTPWSRAVSCALTDLQSEQDNCARIQRTKNDTAALMRFPHRQETAKTFPIVAGHIPLRYTPSWLMERDVRVTTLRNPITCWVSAIMFSRASQVGMEHMSTLEEASNYVQWAVGRMNPNDAYIGHLFWFCSDLPAGNILTARVRTSEDEQRLQRCVQHSIAAVRQFDVVGILEKPANTVRLLQHRLGHRCPWEHDYEQPHHNEATISTAGVLASLPHSVIEKLEHMTRYDRELYDAAVQYNEALVAALPHRPRP